MLGWAALGCSYLAEGPAVLAPPPPEPVLEAEAIGAGSAGGWGPVAVPRRRRAAVSGSARFAGAAGELRATGSVLYPVAGALTAAGAAGQFRAEGTVDLGVDEILAILAAVGELD